MKARERLKLPGVANMRSCAWNRPPIDRMANINIEPGTTPFEKMIERVFRTIIPIFTNFKLQKVNRSQKL